MKKVFWMIRTLLLLAPLLVQAQVTGTWKTIDDTTGEEKSIVEIYHQNDRVYGKIIEVLTPGEQHAVCEKCKGKDKDAPLKGLVIIKDLKSDGHEYKDGTIFDPEVGKTYAAKIWTDVSNNDVLHVRGYIAFFFRTQEWIRIKS